MDHYRSQLCLKKANIVVIIYVGYLRRSTRIVVKIDA